MNIINKFRLPILVFLISTGVNSLRASDSLSIEGYLVSKNKNWKSKFIDNIHDF